MNKATKEHLEKRYGVGSVDSRFQYSQRKMEAAA